MSEKCGWCGREYGHREDCDFIARLTLTQEKAAQARQLKAKCYAAVNNLTSAQAADLKLWELWRDVRDFEKDG